MAAFRTPENGTVRLVSLGILWDHFEAFISWIRGRRCFPCSTPGSTSSSEHETKEHERADLSKISYSSVRSNGISQSEIGKRSLKAYGTASLRRGCRGESANNPRQCHLPKRMLWVMRSKYTSDSSQRSAFSGLSRTTYVAVFRKPATRTVITIFALAQHSLTVRCPRLGLPICVT